MLSFTSTRSLRSARPLLMLAVMASLTLLTAATAAPAAEYEQALPLTAKVETDNYVVEMTASGPFKVGVEGTAQVKLTTKGAYHVNPKYPYRFKTAAPPNGLVYPKPVLQRDDGRFEEKQAVFNVGFVASQAGQFEVGGAFHMSVCSAENCLVDKPSLAVAVRVQ